MRKTPEMDRIELREWIERLAVDPNAQRRDIREIIQSAFDEGRTLDGAAVILDVHPTTLSVWVNKNLGGDICSRVVFPGFEPEGTPEQPSALAEACAD